MKRVRAGFLKLQCKIDGPVNSRTKTMDSQLIKARERGKGREGWRRGGKREGVREGGRKRERVSERENDTADLRINLPLIQ